MNLLWWAPYNLVGWALSDLMGGVYELVMVGHLTELLSVALNWIKTLFNL